MLIGLSNKEILTKYVIEVKFFTFRSDNQGKKCWHILHVVNQSKAPSPQFNVEASHVVTGSTRPFNID